MGNFEKVVVLLILLVCVIVLSISLRPSKVSANNGRADLSALDGEAVDPFVRFWPSAGNSKRNRLLIRRPLWGRSIRA